MKKETQQQELEDFKRELACEGYSKVSDRMAAALLATRKWFNADDDTIH